MDLLFSRYASPFVLLDGMIRTGRFFDFIEEFIDSENEKNMWEYYLHKVFDNRTFEEFKAACTPNDVPSEEQLEATVINSRNMLNQFDPGRG